MKTLITFFIPLVAFFIASCGDNSGNSTATGDTASQTHESTADHSAMLPDTTVQHNGLMDAMNGMMDKMRSMQMTGDFDIDFAKMMIEHHQGGIDMAQLEVSQGKVEQVKAKAQEILTKQQKEQQELQEFVGGYKPSGMKHAEGALQQSMTKMMDKMKSMQMSGNIDSDFLAMMISHHQDGIDMSKMETKNGMSGKLKQMAKKSIDDQQKDIKELQSLKSSSINK